MKKWLKFFLKISVSLGFLTWVILKTDWNQVFFYLREIDAWKLAVYILTILLGILISAHKWRILANFKGIDFPLPDFFRFYLSGAFINNFMPSFIGGDTFRAYQIGKREKKYIEAASSVIADRVTGLVAMTILALLFALINLQVVLNSNLLILINALLILSLIFDVILAKAQNCRFWKKIESRLPGKILKFTTEIHEYSNNQNILSRSIGYGMLFQIVGVAAANLILFWALGIKVGIIDYLSVIFLISIISSVPISINNIGVKEWAYVTFFGIFGLNSSAVITVAILSRFIQMLISFLALPTYLQTRK